MARTNTARGRAARAHAGAVGSLGNHGRAGNISARHGGKPAGGATGTAASAPAPAAPATAHAAAPTHPAPFLTPAQQAQLDTWNTTYGSEMGGIVNVGGHLVNFGPGDIALKLAQAGTTYHVKEAENAAKAGAGSFKTNDDMAGRGLEYSSLRTNALNDIAGTLVLNDNVAKANYGAAVSAAALARLTYSERNNTEQGTFLAERVANAQAIDTNPPPAPSTAPTHPTVTLPPGAASPAAAVSHAQSQGHGWMAPKAPKGPVGMLGSGGRAGNLTPASPRVPGTGAASGWQGFGRAAAMRVGAPS